MESIGNTCAQKIVACGGAQTRNVEIGSVEIAAEVPQEFGKQSLALRMMNKSRFQLRQDSGKLIHGQMMLCVARMVRGEDFFGHFIRELAELEEMGRGE